MSDKPQTIREIAELIARFRTPDWANWQPLADDISTVLRAEREACASIADNMCVGYDTRDEMAQTQCASEIAAQIRARNP